MLTIHNFLLALATLPAANAQLNFGVAKSFGTIAGAALQNTGTTWVGGNIGTYPGTTITGYPPGTLTGGVYPGTSLAQDAQKYCSTAYKKAWNLPITTNLPTPDLSGLTLPPGVYAFPSANVVLNTYLNINGASNPNGQWIFLIKGSFTTAANAYIQTLNGAQACNVYFIVNNSAGVGDLNQFQGNVIAVDTIKVGKQTSNYGTFCTIKGPIYTYYNKLQSYTPTCYF